MKANLIAFCGFSRSGKDEASRPLRQAGYTRHNFGDIIKRQMDPVLAAHMGVSACDENDEVKTRIRPLLELWGEVNYENILKDFFSTLPERAVNTRLVRLQEARAWKERGGVVIHIHKPEKKAATDWEWERLYDLKLSGLIDGEILNEGTIEQLHARVRHLFELPAPPAP